MQPAGLDAWLGPKLIVADGYGPVIPGWELDVSLNQQGSSKTFMRLLEQVVKRWPACEMLTYLQDDVVLARNALTYMRNYPIDENLAFVSWFSHWPAFGIAEQLHVMPVKSFSMSLALTIPRRTIQALLDIGLQRWPYRHQCDLLFRRLPKAHFAVHVPNLVDHVGENNSACAHDRLGPRCSKIFPGADFDALTLEQQAHAYASGPRFLQPSAHEHRPEDAALQPAAVDRAAGLKVKTGLAGN